MTGDEHALVRAIIAAPDDDLPRLVYADWLDENGRPERAEFIRVQCELAALVVDDPVTEARAAYLETRLQDLTGFHDEWAGEVGDQLPPNRRTSFWFVRGMVGEVWCTTKYFAENIYSVVDLAPIREVWLQRLSRNGLANVGRLYEWLKVPGLRLDADDLTAGVVQVLTDQPVAHLRSLKINSHVGYSDPPIAWASRSANYVRTIAGCPQLAGLERLSLTYAGVGDVGGLALAESPWLGGLRALFLTGNPLADRVKERLRDRFGPRVYFDHSEYASLLRYGDLP